VFGTPQHSQGALSTHGALSAWACEAWLKSAAPFLSCVQKNDFQKQKYRKNYTFPLVKSIRRYVYNGLTIIL